MTKYERHPAPEKLLLQITTEAVSLLALGGPDNIRAAAFPEEAGAALIAKAWGLPQEDLEASTVLIQRQKQMTETASEAALPEDRLLEPYDGGMAAELVWGLFETAVRLDDAGERKTIHQLALLMADVLNFDKWIEESRPDGIQS